MVFPTEADNLGQVGMVRLSSWRNCHVFFLLMLISSVYDAWDLTQSDFTGLAIYTVEILSSVATCYGFFVWKKKKKFLSRWQINCGIYTHTHTYILCFRFLYGLKSKQSFVLIVLRLVLYTWDWQHNPHSAIPTWSSHITGIWLFLRSILCQ